MTDKAYERGPLMVINPTQQLQCNVRVLVMQLRRKVFGFFVGNSQAVPNPLEDWIAGGQLVDLLFDEFAVLRDAE